MVLENIIKSVVFPEAIIMCTWLVLKFILSGTHRVSFCTCWWCHQRNDGRVSRPCLGSAMFHVNHRLPLYLQQTSTFLHCFVLQIHRVSRRLIFYLFNFKNFGDRSFLLLPTLLFCFSLLKKIERKIFTLNSSSVAFFLQND